MTQKKLKHSPIVYYISKHDGKAEWICLLHAAFVNHLMFREQINEFKDKYNILAIDIIGHGQSTEVKKKDGILKMSEWIKEILIVEGIEKIHIVGVSLGSVLAQDFANHYPDMVKSLACFGGYDINHFDSNLQQKNNIAQMFMMMKAIFSIKWFAKANKKISAYTEKAQNDFYELNVLFPKKSLMYLAGLDGMVNKHKSQQRMYPLLIGCGENDIPEELDAIKMWKETEPSCRSVVFENAGHCVNMDVPQTFNNIMEKFWNGENIQDT